MKAPGSPGEPRSRAAGHAVGDLGDLQPEPAGGDKADRVRRMFDRIARRYSLVNTVISLGRDRHWRRQAVRLAGVRPGDELLDVCCGPGELADAFAAADPAPARIVACDFSENMLDQARRRQPRRRRPIELLLADAMALPFADGSFDLVSCGYGVRNLADPRAGLAEFRRVLRPGGRLVVLDLVATSPTLGRLRQFYLRRVLPRLGGAISRDRDAYEYLPRSTDQFLTAVQLVEAFAELGLVDVRQRKMSLGVMAVTVGVRRV